MFHIANILKSHPRLSAKDIDGLVDCIRSCSQTAESCVGCADACLAEDMVKDLLRCIRLCQDSADICQATGKVLFRQTETDWNVLRKQVESCIVASGACAEECEKHGESEHCRTCAESCRQCEQACHRVQESIAAVMAA